MIRRALALLTLSSCGVATADDWPQWMGPRRDNVWREEGVIDRFSAGGPPVVWRAQVAGGYSGPAVAQGRVVVTDYVTQDDVKVENFERKQFSGIERVQCLDAATGGLLWKHEYPVKYSMSYPSGPRCTPNIDGDKAYTLGADGHLNCFDLQTGDVVWSKHFPVDYQTKTALWGYASHPLIDGDKIICVVGGQGSHAVAFNKHSGEEIWRAVTSKEQGYSPPLIIEAAGARQLILARPDAISSHDPQTGRQLWSAPYEATNGSMIMTPVLWNQYMFVGSFFNKNCLLKLDYQKPGAEVVWSDQRRKGFAPINVQPFVDDGVVYGVDQDGTFYAVELPSGDRIWETPEPLSSERPLNAGTTFIVRHQDRYWLFAETGELIIANLSRRGYEELDRVKVIETSNIAYGRKVVWCAPAFANRRCYVRNDMECICLDLAP